MTAPLGRDYETVRAERFDSGVTHLQLDRRVELNAISGSVLDDLADALEELDRDDETQVLVVSGAGRRAFSVGADIRGALGDLDADTAIELSRRGQQTFDELSQFPGPVIASIEGYCLGGGMELAACADLRISGPDATFGQPEQELGLLPGWGGTQRLQHIVGSGRANEVILSADEYDAETMAQYGFVNEIADPPLEAARERALSLAEHSAQAQRYAKRSMQHGRERDQAGFQFESVAFGRLVDRIDE